MKKFLMFLALPIAAIGGVAFYFNAKQLKNSLKNQRRLQSYYDTLNSWLIKKMEGGSLLDYFEQNHYQTVAIYGLGELGNRLLEDLKGSGITVSYCVDKNINDSFYDDMPIVSMDAIPEQEAVDVMIVTLPHLYDVLEKELSKNFDGDIISIDDLFY